MMQYLSVLCAKKHTRKELHISKYLDVVTFSTKIAAYNGLILKTKKKNRDVHFATYNLI